VVARLDAALTERFDSAGNSRDGLRSLFQRFSGETLELHSGAPGAFDDLGEAEWTLSLLRLRHCVKLQAKANVPDQIGALRSAGHMSAPDADALAQAVSFLRTVDHAVRLVTGLRPDVLPENPS